MAFVYRSSPASSAKGSGGGHKPGEVGESQTKEEPMGQTSEQSESTTTCPLPQKFCRLCGLFLWVILTTLSHNQGQPHPQRVNPHPMELKLQTVGTKSPPLALKTAYHRRHHQRACLLKTQLVPAHPVPRRSSRLLVRRTAGGARPQGRAGRVLLNPPAIIRTLMTATTTPSLSLQQGIEEGRDRGMDSRHVKMYNDTNHHDV